MLGRFLFEKPRPESDVADGDRLDDPAVQARFRTDHSGQQMTNPVATDNCVAGPRHKASIRFVQGDDCVEIASVEVLLEQSRPILSRLLKNSSFRKRAFSSVVF
jgi:hypothetical protein